MISGANGFWLRSILNPPQRKLIEQKTESGMYKNEVFRSTLSKINLEVNERGLCSKSLGKETVVCTSMILYLMGELKGKVDYEIWHDKYDALARRLWNSRCKYGWGVFMEKPSFEDCSNVNSIWALRALNQYSTRDTREFKEFILEFYEHSKFGKFGFSQQDSSRLTPTAMAIVLYYELEPNLRKRIRSLSITEKPSSRALPYMNRSGQKAANCGIVCCRAWESTEQEQFLKF